jgi:hypothetical protein
MGLLCWVNANAVAASLRADSFRFPEGDKFSAREPGKSSEGDRFFQGRGRRPFGAKGVKLGGRMNGLIAKT